MADQTLRQLSDSGALSTTTLFATQPPSSGPMTKTTGAELIVLVNANAQIAEAQVTGLTADLAAKAPLASPALTGTPTAPTAGGGTNTTQIATCAFVLANVGGGAVSSVFSRTGAIVANTGDYTVSQVTGAAPLASPTFTGTPAAPTASPGTNTTQLATTAFVIANAGTGTVTGTGTTGQLAKWSSSSGLGNAAAGTDYLAPAGSGAALTGLTVSQVSGAAPLASPTFIGSVVIPGGTIDGTTIGGTTPVQAQGYRPINAQTGTTYTLVAGDSGKLVTLSNASAITLTVPTNASVAFAVDTEVDLVQIGAGQVTVSPAGGVTLDSYQGKTALAGQFAGGTLKKIGTNTWIFIGNLA